MPKENGLSLWVDLLRPVEWIESNGAELGKHIILSMPEMGAVGDAVVINLGHCPPIKTGGGTVVTGKFTHRADAGSNVVRLQLEGQKEATGVTDNHPYWSEDRKEFVAVGSLRIGELVNTELGLRRVQWITPHTDYDGTLYNIETTEHVYRVGTLGTLAHNSCINRGGSYSSLRAISIPGVEQVHHMPQYAASIVSRGRGPALGMARADHALTRTFSGKGRITKAADVGLTPMQRLAKDVKNIQTLFPGKYNKGIREMMAYAKTLPEFQ